MCNKEATKELDLRKKVFDTIEDIAAEKNVGSKINFCKSVAEKIDASQDNNPIKARMTQLLFGILKPYTIEFLQMNQILI